MKRRLPLYAVATALIVALSLLILIPVPGSNGFVSLIDAGIVVMGLLFGPGPGLAVGALSGALVDLLSGYAQWVPFSALVHGLQGYIVGLARGRATKDQVGLLIASSVFMVVGYFISNIILYGTMATGIAGLLPDTFQTVIGLILGYPLSRRLEKPAQKFLD